MSKKKLTESEIISSIKNICTPYSDQVIHGIGDDCAVLSYREGSYQIVTTDSMVEDVHFSLEYFNPHCLGYKALAINLSDIASMGGIPKYALVSLGLKDNHQLWIDDFYQGLTGLARQYQVDVVGGNISQSDKNWVSITLIGEVKKENLKTREGLKVGDSIWVTGKLGLSKLGFYELTNPSLHSNQFINYHLKPNPQIKAGIFLSQLDYVNAMMDISDGLAIDLEKMLASAQLGADIFIPEEFINQQMVEIASLQKENLSEIILTGGEDYELLFTVSENSTEEFVRQMKKSNFEFFNIGQVSPVSKQIDFFDTKKNRVKLTQLGYAHFY